jgi:hypothetical protein
VTPSPVLAAWLHAPVLARVLRSQRRVSWSAAGSPASTSSSTAAGPASSSTAAGLFLYYRRPDLFLYRRRPSAGLLVRRRLTELGCSFWRRGGGETKERRGCGAWPF